MHIARVPAPCCQVGWSSSPSRSSARSPHLTTPRPRRERSCSLARPAPCTTSRMRSAQPRGRSSRWPASAPRFPGYQYTGHVQRSASTRSPALVSWPTCVRRASAVMRSVTVAVTLTQQAASSGKPLRGQSSPASDASASRLRQWSRSRATATWRDSAHPRAAPRCSALGDAAGPGGHPVEACGLTHNGHWRSASYWARPPAAGWGESRDAMR
jgi:hypothetical protein